MHIVIDARIRQSSTGRYTDRLIEHLQVIDTENQYTILLKKDDPWTPTVSNFTAQVCDYKQFSFNPIDQIKFSLQLYRLKPDLVHFTMTQQPLFYFGKIITTTHDLTMLRYMRPSRFPAWLHGIGMWLYSFLFWFAHRKSTKIIVPTDYVRNDLATYQPFTATKIVRTYESSEPPIKTQSKVVKSIGSKPFIFHVGQPLPHKNIDRLIKSFEKIKDSQTELLLVLPGKVSGVFLQDLNHWVDTSPHKKSIIIPGFISDEELKWLYENALAYTLPSLSEGFGLPGLEAMAHGCPVVSSNATCLPEVYGEAAAYFDPTDVVDMSHVITKVISDNGLRKSLITKGYGQIKKYSWRTMAKETLDIYQEVLRAK